MMNSRWNRRRVIQAGIAATTIPSLSFANQQMLSKAIPRSGELLPVIGLGTYNVFDVESTAANINTRKDIVDSLVASGGSLLDTSPMYNRSEKIIGDVLNAGADRKNLFFATKVWTNGRAAGRQQMQRSADLMRTDVIDLMQVHNLRDTNVHMATIRELQSSGAIRYSGLTHYTAGAQDDLARAMKQYKPDFIQINYSLGEREAEEQLLPMARDLGVAVLINRPFQSGALFNAVSGKSLPDWAGEFAASWGQFFLKFIVSHPAVSCVIPATSKPHHMIDNLGAGHGPLPDSSTRLRMTDYFSSI